VPGKIHFGSPFWLTFLAQNILGIARSPPPVNPVDPLRSPCACEFVHSVRGELGGSGGFPGEGVDHIQERAGGGFSWFRSEPSTGQSRRSFGLAPHIWIRSTVCGASTEDRGDSRGRETIKIKNVGPGGYTRRARCHRGEYSHSHSFQVGFLGLTPDRS